jgi:hypothetical protein
MYHYGNPNEYAIDNFTDSEEEEKRIKEENDRQEVQSIAITS